jgi:seryl-tRNA synthetase
MKTVVEQLAEAVAQVTALEAGKVEMSKSMTEAQAKVTELSAKIEADAKAHAEAIEKIKAEMDQAAVTAKATADKLTADLATVTTARDEAMKKLASPAYKMAGVNGSETAVPEGGTAAAGGEKVSLTAQMKAISDPVKRAQFYSANAEAIKAELK